MTYNHDWSLSMSKSDCNTLLIMQCCLSNDIFKNDSIVSCVFYRIWKDSCHYVCMYEIILKNNIPVAIKLWEKKSKSEEKSYI